MSNSMDGPAGPGNVENLSQAPYARFRQDSQRLDDELSAELAEISHEYLDGRLDVIEAADKRLAAMQRHLDETRKLRQLHFPEPIEGASR